MLSAGQMTSKVLVFFQKRQEAIDLRIRVRCQRKARSLLVS